MNIQNQYNPDHVSPPGETLKEILEERGLTVKELAGRIALFEQSIIEQSLLRIIENKAPIDSEMALRLKLVLGIETSFWSNRERHYREAILRREEGDRHD